MKRTLALWMGIGCIMGLILMGIFIWYLPDGRTLKIVVCDVGQGDAIYIVFPDGRDMLVDSGPPARGVFSCLGKNMPFWDRYLSGVVLTHPDLDHVGSMGEVLKRYTVGRFIHSNVPHQTEAYRLVTSLLQEKRIPDSIVQAGDAFVVGSVAFSVLWPTKSFVSMNFPSADEHTSTPPKNDGSLVFHLRYGTFDMLFTGDADTRVESLYRFEFTPLDRLEVLKFPHHGSRTGMSDDFLGQLSPIHAIISVGKNSYGHPAPGVLNDLDTNHISVYRTDLNGTITITTTGGDYAIQSDR